MTAGLVEADFTRSSANVCELDAKAETVGFARSLWKLDATHDARANLETLKPLTVHQKEIYHAQTIRTDLNFDSRGVLRYRELDRLTRIRRKRKRYEFPNLYDLQTALLYVRSQKLETGKVYTLVAYPATAPYLATITVLGREKIKVKAGTYPAIKIDLRLQKVNDKMELEPHGKSGRATGWISDDEDRLPVKMNAQIFVGSVWVELEKVE